MTAMLNYYRANATDFARPAEQMPRIAVPTLMIWGEEDTALGLELTEGYAPYVNDFTLRRLPGVSHWVQQEAPARVNAELGAWLEANRPARNHPVSGLGESGPMLLILIILAVIAFGGFGHSGYQRGWYGRDPYYQPPPAAGFGGGGLGLVVLLVVLYLLFFNHHHYY